jgi:hypothetical protein
VRVERGLTPIYTDGTDFEMQGAGGAVVGVMLGLTCDNLNSELCPIRKFSPRF